MEKVALYCRLSVEDEKESIENQQLVLLSFAKEQNWEVSEIYIDEDYSGMRDDRPAFLRMLNDAQNGQFSIILCKTQSRFTRSIETAEIYLHEILPLWGVRFVSVVDGVDTARKEGKKARQINGLVNEWYCEELSENVRAVLQKKREAGQFLGNFAPYGYRKSRANRHKLVVDEAEAEIVRWIYLTYLKGKGCKEIARVLSENGVDTPSTAKRKRGEDLGRRETQAWSHSTVRKILCNAVYMGDMVQGKARKESLKSNHVVAVEKEQWTVVRQTHEGIISEACFQAVAKRMCRKKKVAEREENISGFGCN